MAIVAALQQCEELVAQAYRDTREQTADAMTNPVFKNSNPFVGSWIPTAASATALSLTPSWRHRGALADAAYRDGKLFGAAPEWLDTLAFAQQLVVKFLLCRDLDAKDAADRFLLFRSMVIENGLVFTADDVDVQLGLTLGVFHFDPVYDAEGRPVVGVVVRKMDWEKMTLEQMKKCWFYCIMSVLHSTPVAQTHGMVLTNTMKDFGYSNMKPAFSKFLMNAVRKALPVRIHAAFVGNEGMLFGYVMWPLMKSGLSDKMRARVTVMGTDYSKAKAVLPLRCVPTEFDGERALPLDEAGIAGVARRMDHRVPLDGGDAAAPVAAEAGAAAPLATDE
jgi:hypothetical protein